MTPTIHQALHGYNDGHRLISSSLSLTSGDARTMVVMSDLSGSHVKPDAAGYLTGYPLDGAGKYVIARTWAAPEMPRPGCVWTHSLIIDNADLATLKSADVLLASFRRPGAGTRNENYSHSLSMALEGPRVPLPPSERLRGIVNALYAAPDQVVVAEAKGAEDDERLLTAIWMQQWPRLRRSFGFCTLSGMDRSKKGARLDIQLAPSTDRQLLTKFPDSVTPGNVKPCSALEPLIADLEGRGPSDIREFLRRTGGDVDGGRQAMLPLCSMYSSLFSGPHPNLSAAVAALGALDTFGERQARSVRTLVARKAIEDIDELDDAVFDFVLETLNQGDGWKDQAVAFERIGLALWRRSPTRFFKIVDAGGVFGRAASDALPVIPANALVQGLQASLSLVDRVTEARPDLLERVDFWKLQGVDVRVLGDITSDEAGRIAPALLEAGVGDAASLIVERAAAAELASALNDSGKSTVRECYIGALAAMPEKAAGVLASGRITHRIIVVQLARLADPDLIPNDYGEDPWLIAVRTATEPVEQSDENFLAAFLLSRALGYRSRSQAGLFRFSYTTVHRSLETGRLSAEVERLVTSRLGWGRWYGWDNCSRLRETIVDAFVNRHLDPETFGLLTDDGGLAAALIDEAARYGRGRRYLAEVRTALSGAEEKSIRARADYIAGKIK